MGSPESLEALTAGDKEHLRALVLEYICDRREHGATVDEACQALGLLPSSVAPRFTELRKAGLIVRLHDAKGQRVRRLTRQGCHAGVLAACKFAPKPNGPSTTFPEWGNLSPERVSRLMPHAPWFKFYAADYMSSPFVQSLDPEQELWYLRLIIASAIGLPRGCLPLANGKLWRLAKAPSLEHFEKHADQILAKFERDDSAGVYRVPKVAEQQLVSSEELSSKRSESGKRGAAKRWQTDSKLPSGTMANGWQTDGKPIADSDSDSDSDKKQLPPLEEKVLICSLEENQHARVSRDETPVISIDSPESRPLESVEIPDDLHPLNYGAKICEDLGIPVEGNVRAFGGAIEALIKKGKSPPAAYEFLSARAKDAQEMGELTHPAFWCRDGTYNQPAGHQYRSRADREMDAFLARHRGNGGTS